MNLKTKVAVTGVTNLHDTRYCAGMGVDWVAFPIDASLPHAVNKEDFAEITGWVTGPLFFGEVGTAADVTLSDYQIDGVLTNNEALLYQLGGEMPVAWRIDLAEHTATSAEKMLTEYAQKANWFLLETTKPATALDHQWLAKMCKQYPIVLACEFTPSSANELIDQVHPLGIALTGGKELKVGLNDFDGWADVLEAIELED